jgi:hypothetical protein
MERFVSQQNIERYLKLLDISNDEFQRRLIFKLLSEEQEKLRNIVRWEAPMLFYVRTCTIEREFLHGSSVGCWRAATATPSPRRRAAQEDR